MNNVVGDVVYKDLCCSCGVCVGVCPTNALSMRIQTNGDLSPRVDDERCLNECHLCLDICPFSEGVHNPRKTNKQLFGNRPNSHFDENIGWYIDSSVGFRCDERLRKASASGGLATWCLETLLRKGTVTRVAVVRLAKNHDKGFFEFYSASTVDELRKCSGSVYHPVEISNVVKEITSHREERWGVVGVPCLCAAIRNIGHLRKQIHFVFGLACGMYQNTFYTEMLLSKSGVAPKNTVSIEYRRKSDDDPPSDYRFFGTDNCRHGKEIPYHGLPFFLGKNAYFRQNACNYCMDVFAETADVCFMDAWLPNYSKDSKGTSLVVIRNKAINKLFQQGLSKGEIWIKKISPEQVIQSQSGHIRRKRELIHMRVKRGKRNNTKTTKANLIETVNWLLQKCTQRRSKNAWANYGRKYGLLAFWVAMVDLLLMQSILFNVVRIILLLKRFMRRFRKIFVHRHVRREHK